MGLRSFFELLKNEIFPKGITCNICGKELSDGEREFSLCRDCEGLFNETEKSCIEYSGGMKVYSCFYYEGGARKYILDYKDADKPYLAEYMAKYIFRLYSALEIAADEVTFVPSSPSAKRRRGYDGMEIVAKSFSALSGVPSSKGLFRVDGLDQTKVKIEQREQNVKNKFFAKQNYRGTVLLLDDVVTTGSTLKECSDLILRLGAEKVVCMTLARAEH